MKKYILILLTILGMSVTASAQKGNIKIFSEIKSINVYLDEIFHVFNGNF